ncbi:tRNA-specific 2-thiouridylase MnmA [Fulvivirga imtechensis AK7]|uniref:tRNA-specific 2-thiouridylase MnmA n=1 Tax=Fulvivirga imtechensis AK7 TaxID=1237149 RepID=L8JXC5_9BACT|nr:tRNA 2-thiouridine(34) synthase MnmA [Fulvivirga imtechensis]ELR71872.1 tRNA-specific 2-thiouridylase MnmA [Fulvivirga imtechensis AK7]
MKRVVVGMSGGVDSSVAAYLLKEQGYDVIGMFMKNWHDDSVTISKECPWLEDSNDAMIVAQKLGIPFHAIDLSKEYKERIVDYMFDEYQKGRTPNPDVLCNREIKFDIFLKAAMRLKADFIATGHYCRKSIVEVNGKSTYQLLAGRDTNKDQSYFLCQLTQDQLSKALFPIGELQKSEVRKIAKEQELVTADKKDSQGLCFIGKVRLPEFLQQKLEPKKGKVVEIPADAPTFENNPAQMSLNGATSETLRKITAAFTYTSQDGRLVGEHSGAHYYTIGQRKGLNIGGTPKPLFIIETDMRENIIYTGQGEDHPGLYRKGLFIQNEDIHWVREDLALSAGDTINYMVRIRYRQDLEHATLFMREEGLYIIFEHPQKAIAPGQFAVWYKEDELIGSGVIS